MRLCHISDFHGNFNLLDRYNLPDPDFWVWTGDMFSNNPNGQLNFQSEVDWQIKEFEANSKLYKRIFKKIPIFIVDGNHDYINASTQLLNLGLNVLPALPTPNTYGKITYSGFPYIPYMKGIYNNEKPIMDLNKVVEEAVQPEVNLLITHVPPSDILDMGRHNNFGLKHLKRKLDANEHKIKLHCFGHVHESRGIMLKGETLFSNAACSLNIVNVEL